MRNYLIMTLSLLILSTSACALDQPAASAPSDGTPGVLWKMYTHSGCDGQRLDEEQDLCVKPSKADKYVPGDDAANQAASEWKGACMGSFGRIDTPEEGEYCYVPSDPSVDAPWECDVNVQPTYEACQ